MNFRKISALAMSVAVLAMVSTPAEARRGGSFGSRGAKTHVAPPSTATAPGQVAPVQRTATTPAPATAQQGAFARQPAAAPAKSGGLAKGLIGGLIAGGLVGMLMGNGFGALEGAGMLMALLQAALLAGLVWFAFRMFRRRPAFATAGAGSAGAGATGPMAPPFANASPFMGSQPQAGGFAPRPAGPAMRDLAITMSDKEAFERLLGEVQDAFGREDYARLRACTTPEVMSYLAEELSQNATSGQRNDVTGTELLEAEVAEAWSEGDADYATIAMKYESIDIMRDRTTGAVLSGDPTQPTRTTELWTFVRDSRNPWRLSAIQQA